MEWLIHLIMDGSRVVMKARSKCVPSYKSKFCCNRYTVVADIITVVGHVVLEAYSQRDTHTADVADTVKGC